MTNDIINRAMVIKHTTHLYLKINRDLKIRCTCTVCMSYYRNLKAPNAGITFKNWNY